jgi:hypothetical protein
VERVSVGLDINRYSIGRRTCPAILRYLALWLTICVTACFRFIRTCELLCLYLLVSKTKLCELLSTLSELGVASMFTIYSCFGNSLCRRMISFPVQILSAKPSPIVWSTYSRDKSTMRSSDPLIGSNASQLLLPLKLISLKWVDPVQRWSMQQAELLCKTPCLLRCTVWPVASHAPRFGRASRSVPSDSSRPSISYLVNHLLISSLSLHSDYVTATYRHSSTHIRNDL